MTDTRTARRHRLRYAERARAKTVTWRSDLEIIIIIIYIVPRRPDHKMTPKWAWPGSRDRILHSKDELLTSKLMLHQTPKVNDMFIINKNKTANIKGKN